MAFNNITESESNYRHLEKMTVMQLLQNINREDITVPLMIQQSLPQIEQLVLAITDKMLTGGRLFYIGAGTSGRLGIVDASECPPSFGVSVGLVTGVIAGGQRAITDAVERAEDDTEQGWLDLQAHAITPKDFVVGLAASGTTPYTVSALQKCKAHQITTGSICSNPDAPISAVADFPVVVVVGPEFISGSTRMKSGTAQKIILNMVSTAVMIQLGRVADNKLVNMQLTNEKLLDRGIKILMEETGITVYEEARKLLVKTGSVKLAIENHRS
ncbi:MAG: N-acetylmuramic acid 6-phosphate etherase [Ferruginibacter sp.]